MTFSWPLSAVSPSPILEGVLDPLRVDPLKLSKELESDFGKGGFHKIPHRAFVILQGTRAQSNLAFGFRDDSVNCALKCPKWSYLDEIGFTSRSR